MADEEHIPREQLFALVYAIKAGGIPPDEGEGADPELARTLRILPDRYSQPLASEFRLGPETVERLRAHTAECPPCRMMLLEDAPDAKPPITEADIVLEAKKRDAARKKKVVKFWIDTTVGTTFFTGAMVLKYKWDEKRFAESESDTAELGRDPRDQAFQIDPFMFGMIVCVLIASYFLAEAYVIAKDLWIDFTRWKQAVPVVGKAWAERSKAKERERGRQQ